MFVTEREISGFLSNAVDIFQFTSKSNVEWFDLNMDKVGQCYCSAETCRCEAHTDNFNVERTMIFSKDEHTSEPTQQLTIEDVGDVKGVTFKNFLTFKMLSPVSGATQLK